ncbi:ABC transporter permease (plasmid) [Rhizobium leguminosarum]|uniref:ABC transporter permease n=1 Tax=Rhizobium leguminosarum TaxID=384 RepID=UPI00103F7461|nr:ABC transporter permease [Rhizobium leguminosarum]MBY5474027.1 ABC transporter permease [Rhizobium leguminosarum]TBZ61720.1 ABC transporter permease [Rhizobium leguminosarum bv. viciae]TBZ75457.1 ABC transporter permease [Rhizobium leguminosarum bv. viciae]TCA09928.1 ABC transporter permease [Rhizobium leguminosarum bv. viciae]TCA15164.1 ABC transporter permease [Rhizobium leguminosarum bv. viciae]
MTPRGRMHPGFILVFTREFHWFRRRPFLLFLTTVLPLLLMGLLAAVFSAGLATRLPIAVLDQDGTDLSRQIIRMVDATQDTSVALAVSDLAEGRQLILSGEVHGLLMLPRNIERDVLSGRRPEVVFFYNTQTMTTGNLVVRGVNAAVPAVAAGIRLSLRTAQGEPVDAAQAALAPVPVQVNPLFNPTLNYAHFLLAALMPSVLQVVIITTMAYSLGLDVESRHRLRILRRLGGGLGPALAGKILPYTLIFLAVLGIADLVLFDFLDMPLRGNRWLLLMAGTLFILASQFIGVLLALFLRPMASAISIGSLLAAPAFGFMGIGFPRIGMNDFAYYYGQMIPGTWYLMARIDQTIRGTPLDLSWKPILVLLFLVVLLASVTVLRLEAIRSRNRREPLALREATR